MIGCHTMTVNSQNDAEIDACSKSDCILDELGRCSEVLTAEDLAGVVVRIDNRDLIECNCF